MLLLGGAEVLHIDTCYRPEEWKCIGPSYRPEERKRLVTCYRSEGRETSDNVKNLLRALMRFFFHEAFIMLP